MLNFKVDTKSNKEIKNEQLGVTLHGLEKDIEHFRITTEKKDEQLNKFFENNKSNKNRISNNL